MSEERKNTKRTFGKGASHGYKGTSGQGRDSKKGASQGYKGTSGQTRDSKSGASQGYKGTSGQARDNRKEFDHGNKEKSEQSWDNKRESSHGYRGTSDQSRDSRRGTSQGYKGTSGPDRSNRREADQGNKEKYSQSWESKREFSHDNKGTTVQARDDRRGSSQGYKGASSQTWENKRGSSQGYKGASSRTLENKRGSSQGYKGTSGVDRDSNRGSSRGYKGTSGIGRDSDKGPSQGYRGTSSTDRDSNRGPSQGYRGTSSTDRDSNRGPSQGYKRTSSTDRDSNRGSSQGYRGTAGQARDSRRGSSKSSDEKFDHSKDNIRGSTQNNSDYSEQPLNNKRSSNGQPRCTYIRSCGGCQMQQLNYEDHLEEKQKKVESLIKKYCKVEKIMGMETPYYYRNKVHAVFDHDKKGNPISGVYEVGSHRVVSVENCLIEDQKADAIIASIRGLLKSFKILTYDEDTDYGLLRHVLIRKGYVSGEIMVVLVLSSVILPSKNNFVKALRLIHPEITTIIVNVNDRKTSMILGDKEQVIYGKGYIEDSLLGKTFRISPKSFYQINTVQTEILYSKAMELAGLTGEETVIDAYCGVGTIGLIASDHAKTVIGVELNKDAVKDAIANAKRNQVQNIDFYNNDAGEFMSQMAAREDKVDVVFMDPPRTGSNEQFLDSLALLKPLRVVYISCNPETLERDLGYLTKKGYKAEIAIPMDMFPWTEHVESIILMTYCGLEEKKGV